MNDPESSGGDGTATAERTRWADTIVRLFGDRTALADRYAHWLVTAGIERGLIGPGEAERIWSRHLLNCAVLAAVVPAQARVVDIGSGAGLPGIPLALARPDLRIDLVEPLLRRNTFLQEVVADLGLEAVRVVRGRAEDVVGQVGGADVVTARAVAPLARLSRWAAPLLRVGGQMIVIKGASAADEVTRDQRAVRQAGFGPVTVDRLGADLLETPTTIITAQRTR